MEFLMKLQEDRGMNQTEDAKIESKEENKNPKAEKVGSITMQEVQDLMDKSKVEKIEDPAIVVSNEVEDIKKDTPKD